MSWCGCATVSGWPPTSTDRPPPGPFPVILERTPYGKAEPSPREGTAADPSPRPRAEVAAHFIAHGYAVVYQDCRGRWGSEGRFEKYLAEGEDGYDTLAWIMAQPWCNGRIGTMGLSYAAHTQVAAACLNPPGLACMLVDSGGFSNAYQAGIRQGGAFELKQATWALKQAKLSPEAEADPLLKAALLAEDPRAWFAAMPWRPGHSPLKWHPDYEAYLFEQWRHGQDGAYWRQLGIFAEGYWQDFANVPMLHMSSWYDAYVRTATENYLGLKAAGKGPLWLVMGPWTHGDRSLRVIGDVDFGAKAPLDGNLAEDFRLSAALVRPLAARHRQWRRPRSAGQTVRDGRRRRRQIGPGPSRPRRRLARFRRLAAAGGGHHRLLPARRRQLVDDRTDPPAPR